MISYAVSEQFSCYAFTQTFNGQLLIYQSIQWDQTEGLPNKISHTVL